jgi:hypothetical protein
MISLSYLQWGSYAAFDRQKYSLFNLLRLIRAKNAVTAYWV